ncbi:MAG: ribosome small subunit-dependent GTPase A [Myxococcota bacterium]
MAGGRRKKPARRRRSEETPSSEPDFDGGTHGVVVAHHGVAVLVRAEDGAERQIWLQPEQRAVVGDRVRVDGDRLAVEPAHGVLRRRDPRGRERTIATNLDWLGIVVAVEPREPPGYIDRGFVIARAAGIEPFLVLNKIDLDEGGALGARLEEIYSASGPVFRVSAERGEGLAAIPALLAGGRLGAFVGPSGVGKSSLLNALVPDLDLRVGALNRGSGKGTHTTTTATLHALDGGGFLVDTAGFKDFIAVDVEPFEAAAGFPGLESAGAAGCRFRDCLHRTEPGCGVLAALEAGEIDARRHRAYVQLVEELEAPETLRR